MRTIDVIRANIKRPFVIACEEQLIPTVKRFFDDRDKNVDYIVSTGVFPADKIAIMPIETNAESIKIATDIIEWYYNDYDNVLLFNSNSNPDKKERLLVDEVNSNNESVQKDKQRLYEFQDEQLDFINKCFGTHMYFEEEEVNEDDAIQRMGGDTDTGSDRSVGSGSSDN